MKLNKNGILLIGGFILLGLNLGMINWGNLFDKENLVFLFGIIASLFIILTQFDKLKKQNE
ncbi:MAG: hypothetical protein ACTIJ9_07395 [Aequorivita sp.]